MNGIELADPSLRSPDLRLYDVTTHLKPGENILAFAVEGGAHFVLDLFTVSLE